MTVGSAVLRDSIMAYRRKLSGTALLLILHQAGEALVPVLVGVVIDKAVRVGDPKALVFWLALLGVDFLVLSNSHRIGAQYSWQCQARADQRLRMQVTERVLDARGGAESALLPGALVNVAVSDAKRVAQLHLALPFGVAALVAFIVAGVALLRISLPLGLLILLGSPPLLLLLRALGRPLRRRSGAEQERAAHAAGIAADLVQGIRVLKGLGAEGAAVRRYTRGSRESLTATLHAGAAQGWYQGAVLAVNGLFLALIALVGGRLAAEGSISIGELVSAVGLAQFLLGPLNVFGRVVSAVSQARASADRLATVLSTPPAVIGGGEPPGQPVVGGLRIEQLRHGALTRLDLRVAPGELLGVVSADPASVVALLECLNRETDPDSGRIELDGTPLTELDPGELRGAILVSAHNAELFAGTVRENVTAAAAPGADPGPALRAAQADEVASALPAGLDSPVSEQGRSLSGGQRQRVALARALAADAPVLVLHDPTTALDSVTEARVAEALGHIRAGRTTIVATTSPAILAACDRVVTVEDGALRASGSHAELVREDADYRALVLA
jgi:putative ABC transport system ATP-binding protein